MDLTALLNFEFAPIHFEPSDFITALQYFPWLLLGLVVWVHFWLSGLIHRRVARLIDDEAVMSVPLPFWTHLAIAPLSLALTGLPIWVLLKLVI